MDILDRILQAKTTEIREYRHIFPKGIQSEGREKRSLYKRLKEEPSLTVISEIKRGSPSKGHFAPDLDATAKALQYDQSGAGAISVLTDRQFFHGGFADLRTIRSKTALPLLCKDFILDEIQIDIADHYGADLILLIVAALEEDRLVQLLDYARSKGLEVLLEVHDRRELEIALRTGHRLIGINNRNLKTFKTDLAVSLELITTIMRPEIACVSESGIHSVGDAATLIRAGFDGILVGESLIRNDPSGTMLEQMTALTKEVG